MKTFQKISPESNLRRNLLWISLKIIGVLKNISRDSKRRLKMKKMKKIISLAVFAIMSAVMSFAQDADDELYDYITMDGTATEEITSEEIEEPEETSVPVKEKSKKEKKDKDNLSFELSKDLEKALKNPGKNAEKIQELTFELSMDQKEELYAAFEKTKGTAIGMNWLPGFGSGSFVQGDGLGGGLGVAFDTVAIVGVGGGLVIDLAGLVVALFSFGTADDTIKQLMGWGTGAMIGGAVLWLGNKIFGTVRPISFAKNYNRDLKSALGLDEQVESISFVPIVDPLTGSYGLSTQIRF